MPLVGSNSPTAVSIDGVYLAHIAALKVQADPTTAFGALVGFATDGEPDRVVPFDRNTLTSTFGQETTNARDLVTQGQVYLAKSQIGFGVRVVDGTEVAAVIPMVDGSAGTLVDLTAKWVGSGPNGSYAFFTFNTLATSGDPAYDLTIQKQSTDGTVKANAEVWHNIAAPDLATFKTNVLNAVNNGTLERPASQYWVATSGAGSGTIVADTHMPVVTSGTDGTITDALVLGATGNPNTGMYALDGAGALGVNAFVLCGVTTRSYDATIGAFVQGQVGISMGGSGFASGTTPATAQGLITSYPVGLFRYLGFIGYGSSIVSQNGYRRISPAGAILSTIVSTPPQNSIGDQPRVTGYPGIIDSEMDQLSPNNLNIGQAAQYTAQQLGLLYFTRQTPQGGGVFALPHGQSAAVQTAGQDQVSEQRMNTFLEQDALNTLGQFVHLNQSASSSDPFRRAVVNTMNARYTEMVRAGQIASGNAIDQLSGQSATPTAGDNSTTTILEGFNFLELDVTKLSAVRWIIGTLNS